MPGQSEDSSVNQLSLEALSTAMPCSRLPGAASSPAMLLLMGARVAGRVRIARYLRQRPAEAGGQRRRRRQQQWRLDRRGLEGACMAADGRDAPAGRLAAPLAAPPGGTAWLAAACGAARDVERHGMPSPCNAHIEQREQGSSQRRGCSGQAGSDQIGGSDAAPVLAYAW